MAAAELIPVLMPISAEAPSGPNAEYEPDFIAMERAAEGRPEQATVAGQPAKAADPPDWHTVARLAKQLSSRTHDLRVATLLTRAQLNLHGFAGLAEGLRLLCGLLEQHWETLHPQLDPDDGLDPVFRLNILSALCDWQHCLQAVVTAQLASVKGLGNVTLRDLQIARGEVEAPADPKRARPDSALIEAIFSRCPQTELQTNFDSIQAALTEITAIDKILIARVGSAQSVQFDPLIRLLEAARAALVDRRGEDADATAVNTGQLTGESAPAALSTGPVRSRQHAVQLMDAISAYFLEHEPSSPVPLFMERAKRLTDANFLDILQDLAPDGLKQARIFSGAENGKTK